MKHIGIGALLLSLMFLAYWIRIQGSDALPDGQFTENDAYLYYWQAGIIGEKGWLPEKDMSRWLPHGRDNRQLLSLYSYTIAYTHKVIGWLFPNLTLYQIQLYVPVVCFTLGLGVLLLLLVHSYGFVFAAIVGVLLATLPGSIERSAIGFGDRDAFCWLFGVLAVTLYLWKETLQPGRRRWIATILSSITVFLGGLAWEGFGFLLAIILTVELWKFCTTDKEHNLKEYSLWVLLFVPGLYLIAPAYRSGYGFSTHLAALMLLPPLIIFVIRGARYLLLQHVLWLRPHPRKLAWGLTCVAIVTGAYYFFIQYSSFETTAFTFRESSLMKNVGELVDPSFLYWTHRYGAVFLLGSIGLILSSSHFGVRNGIFLGFSFFLFIGTTFFRDLVSHWVGTDTCDILFIIALGLTVIALGIASLRKTPAKNEQIIIAMFVWFILWVALARSGKRYDFFVGVPLAFGAASMLCISSVDFFIEKVTWIKAQKSNLKEKLITASIATVILIAILFLLPLGGHVTRIARADFQMRLPIPGEGHMAQALTWIKDTIPKDTVLAANWSYGSQINIFGGVKTITDQDHFIPHWIHLYYRHVFCAQSEKEALEYLKTHEATHLLLTDWGITSRAQAYSKIGSDENMDRSFGFYPLRRFETPIGTQYRMIPTHPDTPFSFIDFNRTSLDALTLTVQFKGGNIQKIQVKNPTTLKMVELENGGLALYFDKHTRLQYAYYIPPIGWNSLAVKLFLRGEHNQAFVRIYPVDDDNKSESKIKIWKIQYPQDINTSEKYLKTTNDSTDVFKVKNNK